MRLDMARVLFAVTGSQYWTLNDGTKHPCGYWPEELAVPHEVFAKAGLDITVATPGAVRPVPDEAGFSAAMNGGSEEPGQRFRTYLASIEEQLRSPEDLDDISADDFDLVFVPGGHGPMEDLASSPAFGALVVEFTRQSKPVAAVCHGPAALLPARDAGGWLFRGRRVTGFTNAEEEQVGFADRAPWRLEDRLLEDGGAFESSSSAWQPHVAVDGNLYSGQNPASSEPLAQQLLAAVASAHAGVK
jgi:putative intracellular protease/amidase